MWMVFVDWKKVVINTDWIEMEVCCKESCRNEIDLQARNAIAFYICVTCYWPDDESNDGYDDYDDNDYYGDYDDVSLLTSSHLISIL
jgi:hypothetical protein